MKQLFCCCLFALLFCACTRDHKTAQSAANSDSAAPFTAAKMCVKPPLNNLQVMPKIFTVNPAEAKQIAIRNGGSIAVPAGAFVYADGRPVTESVELRFREFHTAGEIIASGIPMKAIGPDGQEGHMQTAGMFELEGFVNNTAVKIAPGKTIAINLSSNTNGRYDTWFFDTQAGNWLDIGDSDAVLATPVGGENTGGNFAPEVAYTAPVKPVLLDKSKPKLNFDINYDRFPELKTMQNRVLQYTGSDKAKDPANNNWIFTHSWENIKLDKANTPGQYTLVLESEDKSYTIPVSPCLTGAAYEVALRDYRTQLADYEKARVKLSDQQMYQKEKNNYLRSVGIDVFGIYNYDIFWKQSENVQVLANFNFDNQEIPTDLKNSISVYLVCRGGSMVIGYDQSAWSKFAFNPNDKDNRLLAVLPDQRVALLTEKAFNALLPTLRQSAHKNFTFNMPVQAYTVSSTADLDRALSL